MKKSYKKRIKLKSDEVLLIIEPYRSPYEDILKDITPMPCLQPSLAYYGEIPNHIIHQKMHELLHQKVVGAIWWQERVSAP